MSNDINKLTKEELVKYINELKRQLNNEKYGLYFDRKATPEEIIERTKNGFPYLSCNKNLSLKKGTTNNLLIEGDNFISLTALSAISPNAGFIDVIYIDPPYNTGKEDFTYNDRYIDQEDSYRHTKWLNFMEKRLKLARDLLKDDGVIFISIDDNEQAQLKLLMDSIFGERNHICNFIWNMFHSVKNDANNVSKNTEYILCYAKNILYRKNILENEDVDKTKNYPYDDNDGRGKYKLDPIYAKSGSDTSKYEYTFKNGYVWSAPSGAFPRYSFETLTRMENENRIVMGKTGSSPMAKRYLNEVREGRKFSSLLKGEDVGYSLTGVNDLKKIVGKVFDNPKPVSLIKKLLSLFKKRDNLQVLDFFAGSGTTGQAVLELNNEDGGNRRFILCTNNDNEIMSKVCYPRLNTVITGFKSDGTVYSKGYNTNLIYLKNDLIENKGSKDQIKFELAQNIDPLLSIIEDTFEIVKSEERYAVYSDIAKEKYTIVFKDFYNKKDMNNIHEFVRSHRKNEIVFYQFSTDNIIDTQLFENDTNVKHKPIPQKIFEIYKNIMDDIKRDY